MSNSPTREKVLGIPGTSTTPEAKGTRPFHMHTLGPARFLPRFEFLQILGQTEVDEMLTRVPSRGQLG